MDPDRCGSQQKAKNKSKSRSSRPNTRNRKSQSVEKWLKAINEITEEEKQTIHLIAHAKPGHLHLGSGAAIETLDQISATSDNTIVVWGCNFGQSRHYKNPKSNRLIASSTTLGNKNTIEGFGKLSKAIYEWEEELSSFKWKSNKNNLKANNKPVRNPSDKSQWIIGPEQGAIFWKSVQGHGITIPKKTQVPSVITSNRRDFREWTGTLSNPTGDFKLTFPSSIIKENPKNYELTLNTTGRSINSWKSIVDTESISLPLLNWKTG